MQHPPEQDRDRFGLPRPPLVSVCIPTYNYGRFVGQAIESVMGQTLQDWELIVCDNASTDDTQALVQKWSDSRIRYKRQDSTVPMIRNFNRCLKWVRGEYVLFLCADDALSPSTLERLVAGLQRESTAGLAVARRRQDFDASGRLVGPVQVHRLGPGLVDGAQVLEAQCHAWVTVGLPPQVLARTSAVLDSGGFDPRAEGGADNDLFSRICFNWDALYVDDASFFYRVHDQMAMRRNRVTNSDIRAEHYIFAKLFREAPVLKGNRRLRRAYVKRLYPWWFPRALQSIRRGDLRSAFWIFSRVATFEPVPWWIPYYGYRYAREQAGATARRLRRLWSGNTARAESC